MRDYKDVKLQGSGGFADVRLIEGCVGRNWKKIFVAKRNKRSKHDHLAMVELSLLRSLEHPNIVRTVDSFMPSEEEIERGEDAGLINVLEFC
jgi:hypothetical protein